MLLSIELEKMLSISVWQQQWSLLESHGKISLTMNWRELSATTITPVIIYWIASQTDTCCEVVSLLNNWLVHSQAQVTLAQPYRTITELLVWETSSADTSIRISFRQLSTDLFLKVPSSQPFTLTSRLTKLKFAQFAAALKSKQLQQSWEVKVLISNSSSMSSKLSSAGVQLKSVKKCVETNSTINHLPQFIFADLIFLFQSLFDDL